MAHAGRHSTFSLTPVRLVAAVVVAAVVGAAITLVLTHKDAARHAGAPGATGSTATTVTSTSNPPMPLRVVSITPTNGSIGVSPRASIAVTFSSAISPRSPMPAVTPAGAGTWHLSGSRRIVFVPELSFLPLSEVKIAVPAGPAGVEATDGGRLGRAVVDDFRIVDGSTSRLQQLLSLLDYSPLAFRASGQPISNGDEVAQRAALFEPAPGRFAWRQSGWPRQLHSLWRPGRYNVFTRGLVMEFEADHGLPTTGLRTEALWRTLLGALASGEVNTGGYNYALGDQAQPETFTVWHNGKVVLRVPANTGISQSPTADGNFPVYERLRRQVMKGTNPDGTKYADPVQYVAYFNGGDAVHYFPRAAYGIPQSLGCIELQLGAAAKAWPYLAYGTIVSVTS